MTFGKPGRPADDRLARQREIYEAVAPLILEIGARRLSMRQAAQAACLSVGGLYHHFATKQEMVLHGLQPAAIARYCQDFHDRFGYLAIENPQAFLDAYTDFVTSAVYFIRPSVYAALDLGIQRLEDTLEPTLQAANDEFTTAFSAAFPGVDLHDVIRTGRAIHRTLLSALFDKRITWRELRDDLSVVIISHLEQPAEAAG